MSSQGPVGVYGLEVSPELPTHANEAMAPLDINITMAAIDPTEEVDDDDGVPRRATLVMMRVMPDSAEDDSDEEDEDDDSNSRGKLFEALKAYSEKAAGKAPKDESDDESAESGDDNDSKDGSADDDESDEGYDEFVVCTLDSHSLYQQPLNITISAQEQVFFRVKGNLTVNLTGNYLIPRSFEDNEDSEDDSDDDEDPLGLLHGMDLDSEDDSEDELDDTEEEPRIVELKESKAEKGKKRAAEESKPSVAEKKQKTAAVEFSDKKADKEDQKKKKQKEVEQPKQVEPKAESKPEPKGKKDKKQQKTEEVPEKESTKEPATRTVKGVKIEDKKIGDGPVAKSGSRVEVRYIGKLTNGDKFDSNTKGKPFSFNLGKSEVIQGWDIGVVGMKPGGERRLTVPANLAYGKRALGGIPANSTLIFEIKLLKVQ